MKRQVFQFGICAALVMVIANTAAIAAGNDLRPSLDPIRLAIAEVFKCTWSPTESPLEIGSLSSCGPTPRYEVLFANGSIGFPEEGQSIQYLFPDKANAIKLTQQVFAKAFPQWKDFASWIERSYNGLRSMRTREGAAARVDGIYLAITLGGNEDLKDEHPQLYITNEHFQIIDRMADSNCFDEIDETNVGIKTCEVNAAAGDPH